MSSSTAIEWVRRVGSGPSGVVWLVVRDGRELAIKIVRAGPAETEAVSAAVDRARRLSGIPGVVRCDGVEATGDLLHIETEMVPGPSLAQIVRHRNDTDAGPVTSGVAVIWLQQVLATLEAASELLSPESPAAFAHAGLKPTNLLLDPRAPDGSPSRSGVGRMRIADFFVGRARAAFRPELDGRVPPYTAPEVLLGRQPDARSDQFALAAVFYELLSGRPLYAARDVDHLLALAIAADVEPALAQLRIPAGLVALLRRMLARDPGDRYPSHREVIAALASPLLSPGASADLLPELMASWSPPVDADGQESHFDEVDEFADADAPTDELVPDVTPLVPREWRVETPLEPGAIRDQTNPTPIVVPRETRPAPSGPGPVRGPGVLLALTSILLLVFATALVAIFAWGLRPPG